MAFLVKRKKWTRVGEREKKLSVYIAWRPWRERER